MAGLLLSAAKFPEAREHAQAVLKSDPKNAEAQVILSDADATDNLPKAVEEAEQAVQMNPARAVSYLNLGALQERSKNFPAAEQNFQKSMSLDPKSTGAMLGLGQIVRGRETRTRKPKKSFQAAAAAQPKDPSLRATFSPPTI